MGYRTRDVTCPVCEGTGKDIEDQNAACPCCIGDGVMPVIEPDDACSGCAGITHSHTCGDPSKQPQITAA